MGGAFFLQHSYGEMIFLNNTFRNNSAVQAELNDDMSIKESAGGAIYCFGYTTSKIYLENNKFFKNQATRGDFLPKKHR